ncbi:MAG TPA: hypothetical protein VGP07_21405 [Polyangia bacterium]|jgi:ketosteroid isomerase-like protein
MSATAKPKWDPALVRGHKNYVNAINSNDTRQVMRMYDAEAVVMQPDGPLVQGARDLEAWVAGYFYAFKTHWVKKSQIMWVAGDFGFDQGVDTAVDHPIERDKQGKPVKLGKPIKQVVKGILIYKRQKNGEFLIYRDIWNFNTPPVVTRDA